MFRNFLKSNQKFNQIELIWMKKLNGLIRVVIFDPNGQVAYVVVYYEQKNKYTLNAFCSLTGELYWSIDVPNGGYGAPAITNDCVVILTEFTNIMGICKNTGVIKWIFKTEFRIRSPINFVNDRIYFSSGGTLIELSDKGELLNQWNYPKAFFYGSVDILNELVITLGVINDEFNKSIVKIFAFYKTGQIVYELPVCKGGIISTDTSGIAWHKNIGFIGAENLIISFQGDSGNILWNSKIEGCASRQVCSVDDQHIYYVTQSGVIGALNILNGSNIWEIHTQDSLIVSPISLAGDKLIVAADAHLLVLKKDNGQLLQKIPVGHSPYSMLSLNSEFGVLGAGEPPHNGLMYGFKLQAQTNVSKYCCLVHVSNAQIENSFFDAYIEIHNAEEEIISAQLDNGNFYLEQPVEGEKVNAQAFSFRVNLPSNICSGDYVLQLSLGLKSGKKINRPVAIQLTRRKQLPSRVYLDHIPDIVQEKPNYSGAAIASVLKSINGDNITSQKNIREMIDSVRNLSGYEPFQTWRIILRRVLTSQAKNKQELPEFSATELKSTKAIKLL